MAASTIPFPTQPVNENAYREPYEAEFLALVATDGPESADRSWGVVVDFRTRAVVTGGQDAVFGSLEHLGLVRSA